MSWWDRDFFFGQYSDVSRVAETYQPQAGPQLSEISFRLCGFAYDLSLAEFGSALGLYTEQELQMPIYTTVIHTADDAVISAWWPRIGDEPFVRAARVTRIRDLLIRYLHWCIASSVTGRGLCTGSFRQTDGAGHAYRAEVPRGGASIFPAEGGHLEAGAK
ncbi:hypothetical protein R6Q57_017191 [Mikania cordata]